MNSDAETAEHAGFFNAGIAEIAGQLQRVSFADHANRRRNSADLSRSSTLRKLQHNDVDSTRLFD